MTISGTEEPLGPATGSAGACITTGTAAASAVVRSTTTSVGSVMLARCEGETCWAGTAAAGEAVTVAAAAVDGSS